MKMPAMQFYPGDWRKDPGVQSLGYFDRGVWFEMICLMHESSERGVLLLNGKPMPDEALANILGLDNQTLTKTLTTLLTYGVAKRRQTDGAIYSKRMVEDESICQIRRIVGKKGGNPSLVNQKSTKTEKQVNQKSTPSSSSSSSTSVYNPEVTLSSEAMFSEIWARYPNQTDKSKAFESFKLTVQNGEDFVKISKALDNYLKKLEVEKTEARFIKGGANWFSNWTDWLNYKPPSTSEIRNKSVVDMADYWEQEGLSRCHGSSITEIDGIRRCNSCNVEQKRKAVAV